MSGETKDDIVNRIKRDLYDGNGRRPILKEVELLRRDTDKMWADLYHNPHTGEAGIVSDVREIKRLMVVGVAWIKGAVAAVAVGAGSGVAAAVKVLLGL